MFVGGGLGLLLFAILEFAVVVCCMFGWFAGCCVGLSCCSLIVLVLSFTRYTFTVVLRVALCLVYALRDYLFIVVAFIWIWFWCLRCGSVVWLWV